MPRELVHPHLGRQIRAIGGEYAFLKEVRSPDPAGDLLYLVGVGCVNSSCCGDGGVAFALVAGHVLSWRPAEHPDGTATSVVEPIADPAMRALLTRAIRAAEHVQDVRFLPVADTPSTPSDGSHTRHLEDAS
ncbi:MAG: hypothetical protein HYV63_02215 [Candidatus Schekmanbacteria bacterium]|nr:hypothetical protein [Candidatus Schekmanbacteria bacterium]